jgi:hypothetical protein
VVEPHLAIVQPAFIAAKPRSLTEQDCCTGEDASAEPHPSTSAGTRLTIRSALCLAYLSLSSCAGGRTAGEHIADMPHWMGGLPADAPPRRGTPEYDEMVAKRAQEAARPKTEQQQPK